MPKDPAARPWRTMSMFRFCTFVVMFCTTFFLSGCINYTFTRKTDGKYYRRLPQGSYTLYATRKRSDMAYDGNKVWGMPKDNLWFSYPNAFCLERFVDKSLEHPLGPPERVEIVRLKNNDRYRWELCHFSMARPGIAVVSFDESDKETAELRAFLKVREIRALKFVK